MSAGTPPENGPPPDEQPTVYYENETVVDSPVYVEPPIEPPIEPGPPMPPPEEPPASRELWPWLVLLMVLVAGGLLAAYLLTRNGDDGGAQGQTTSAIIRTGSTGGSTVPADSVIVPSVVGMKQAEAETRLEALKLESQVRRQESARPAGTVLNQNPAAGVSLKPGALVGLTVSSGPAVSAVPDVVGLTAAEAAAKLQKAGLGTRRTETDSLEAAGTVVAQSPAGGSDLAKGGSVVLTVSKGPPDVTVPDVVGMTRKAAETELRGLGFELNVHAVPSPKPPGTVVAQHPVADDTAPQGSSVRLNVAKNPASGGGQTTPTSTAPSGKADVPEVTGEDEQQAASDLESAGFRVQTADEPVSDETQDGVVLAQRPAGGARASSGSTVTITVGRFSG